MTGIRRIACVLAASGTLAAACSAPSSASVAAAPHQLPAAQKTAQQAAQKKAARIPWVGVYEVGAPTTYAPVETFAKSIGRQPNITLMYSGWWEKFQAAYARAAWKHHASVFVDIDPGTVSVADIAAGRYNDSYLKTYAQAVHKFGHRVIISFGHEPNGTWYSWGYTHTKASTYIKAWRDVVTVFRKYHATNVTWLWVVNREAGHEGPIRDWWPGSSYVNWTGIDGYYETKGQTFGSVFGPTITALRKFAKKPVLISETAIGPVTGQANSIPGLFAGIRRRHLLGLVWFDKGQHKGSHHQNWRIEGNAAAVAAFRRGLHG
jgi:mannan endo-1,4-beta-mannosidase